MKKKVIEDSTLEEIIETAMSKLKKSPWYELNDKLEVVQLPEPLIVDYDDPKRIIGDEVLFGDIAISTVFLGLDHGEYAYEENKPKDYEPVVFETLVSSTRYPKINGFMVRYTTYTKAYLGHKTVVRSIRKEYGKKEEN